MVNGNGDKDMKRYLPKSKRQRRMDKLAALAARIINPVVLPFRHALIYKDGGWQFSQTAGKPKKIRNTFNDGTPRWNLDGAGPLPMDENAIRRLMEVTGPDEPERHKSRTKLKARRYIPPHVSVEELFDQLNAAGIRYAVLRWFDKLPVVDPGEDIDMLFEDEAMDQLDRFFQTTKAKGAIPCDIYSASGLSGSAFEGIPYFEKRLALQLLDNTVVHAGRFKVPDTRHHFLSLAYHAVYHKAHSSGVAFCEDEQPLKKVKDHDYAAVLSGLANDLGIKVRPVLSDLHDYLKNQDWAPAVDTIRKLSVNRPLLTRFLDRPSDKTTDGPNLCVFVVRDWAFRRNLIPWLCANIRFFGFDIKLVHELNDEEIANAKIGIRGGNWNRGPWPVSGGAPAAMIVAYDYTPEQPDYEMARKQPFAANARFVNLKTILRNGINRYLPDHLHANAVHSADDDLEAWDYIRIICPQHEAEIRSAIAAGYQGDPYIRLKMHQGKRAAGYIVYHDAKPCILKVFADNAESMQGLAAEKKAFELFGNEDWSSDWISFGPNWMLQRYHDQTRQLDKVAALMDKGQKLAVARKCLAIAKSIHAAGYAHCDFHAENFFVDGDRLVLMDFETFREQDKSVDFSKSYDITAKGLPSPLGTGYMCYTNTKNPKSLCNTLGVTFEQAMDS